MRRKRRGRSEGSIFERADGTWTASVSLGYDENGKRRRRTVYGSTKKEVQDKLLKLQSTVANGSLPEAHKVTLTQFLTTWLEDLKARSAIKPTTATRYDQLIRLHIVPHLGSLAVAKLAPYHIERLYAEMARAGDSDDTRYKAGVMLGTALRQAARRKMLPSNPVREVEKPKPTREEIMPLDGSQAARFLEASLPERLYALYVLALDSGMRQGELFGLQWEDIDWERGTVQVRHSLEELKGKLRLKEVKTKKGRRRIQLAPSTVTELHEHRKRMVAEGNGTGPVFCDHQAGWLRKSNVVRRSFQKVLQRANKKAEAEAAKLKTEPALLPDIRFHDLRHTCASLLLLANVNPKVVSERLGHAKISTTLDIYSHLLPTMQDGAAAHMETLLHGKKASNG